jgi:hypothetical protein
MSADWMPIDTAPRDGTRIMLYTPPSYVCLAVWRDKAAFARNETGSGWEVWNNDDDSWYSFSLEPEEPTHWMPIPTPPQEET